MLHWHVCGMNQPAIPTMNNIRAAQRLLSDHLGPTPMWAYPTLDATTGLHLVVKHENVQPIGAFKVRGGMTLLADLSDAQRNRGVIAYSTGNHAQSVAYAAAHFGAPCTIVMPSQPNPVKAASVRALGAELIEHGPTFEEASVCASRLAEDRGMYLVSAANDPRIIAGVATLYVEMLEAHPDLDVILVPVGSGSGAAAACLVARELATGCRIIAVQSSASPAAYDSWRLGRCVSRPNRSRIEGIATGTGFELTQRIMRQSLATFCVLDDAQITQAQRITLRDAHTLAEGAGATALAGAIQLREQLRGLKVGIVCTGGNASEAELRECLKLPVGA